MAAETMNKHSVIFELMRHYRSTGNTKNLDCNSFLISPFENGLCAFYAYDNDVIVASYMMYKDQTRVDINQILPSKVGGGYAFFKSDCSTKVQIHGVTCDTASTEDMFQVSTMCNAIENDLLKISSIITLEKHEHARITLFCTEDNIPSTEQLIQEYNSVSDVQYTSTNVREYYE